MWCVARVTSLVDLNPRSVRFLNVCRICCQATSWASPVRSLEGSSALSMYVKMVYVSIATATLSGESSAFFMR